jgi:type I restriction enzyme S subunit
MIANLKPYPEYKESGLPWLGQVPGHWVTRRAKFLLHEIDSRSSTGKEQLLRVSQYTGVTQRKLIEGSEVPDTRASSLIGYKLVAPNDLVINIMLAWNGSMGVSPYSGITSPAYCVYRFSAIALPWYFHHLLRTPAYKDRIKMASTGVVESRLRLYSDDLGRLELPLPPLSEQAAIVRFLDWASSRLDRAIQAKRKVIALLNEQKQAIIHRTVTRGLDPTVKLKPSGIPWLGDIPVHWEIVTLGRLCVSRCDGPFGSSLKSAHYTDSGVQVIRLQNIGSGEFRFRDGAFISPDHYATLGEHGVIEGDLLVAGLGDERIPAGRACVAPPNLGSAMVKADCFRFRLRTGYAVAQFISAQLSATAAGATSCLSTGATRLRINLSSTASRSVAIPPHVEQHEILMSIDRAVAPMMGTISRLTREIDLLREYRTRLVADVVTGKLDVREAAARLPDEAPLDVVDDDTDMDEETDTTGEETSE